ncbi:conserved protein of unknown function (plasmid) [Rhodovastum atsumiense]|uniref:Phage tail protein n=1 Tax=Rhodovastum atsumiense TaxID=504468 RepID=A0A5M6IQ92_9PROT|nr:hypothetical protein [Rhodovastum atsumiense]KAA5609645.1 hypothetical protein F1189_23060 [Rhodovastum atsumiense]CAH2606511.1 conserved protein of unknown function [Rhodovastum atsumiense]
MADLAHTMGSDLSVGATGDLALSTGSQAGQERVLRRLLTNPTDYLWDLGYGAGLPAMVGQPANAQRIAAIARAQMRQEAAVASSPAPTVTVSAQDDGTVVASIRYVDADTGETQTLTAPVT